MVILSINSPNETGTSGAFGATAMSSSRRAPASRASSDAIRVNTPSQSPGIVRQRGAEQVDRLGRAALLMADDGQQVAGVEMVGTRDQDIAAQSLGFGEPTLTLTGGRAIQRLGQAHRVCLR